MGEHVVYTKFKLDKPSPYSNNIYSSNNIKSLLRNDIFKDRLKNNRIYGSVGGKELVSKLITYDLVTHVVKDIFISSDNKIACLIKTLNKNNGILLDERLNEGSEEYVAQFIIMGAKQRESSKDCWLIRVDDIKYVHLQCV